MPYKPLILALTLKQGQFSSLGTSLGKNQIGEEEKNPENICIVSIKKKMMMVLIIVMKREKNYFRIPHPIGVGGRGVRHPFHVVVLPLLKLVTTYWPPTV